MRKWTKRRIYALQLRFPRFKLRRICKALGVNPYPWQRDFALGRTESIPKELTYIRASGKTTAVWLRLLMANPGQPIDIAKVLKQDPDFPKALTKPYHNRRLIFYHEEYWKLANTCMSKNIPCPRDLRIYALYDETENT